MTEIVSQDRAFQYGDGLFSTMHIENGKVGLWRFHRARLLSDSARLLLPIDIDTVERNVEEAAMECQQGVLKVHISSGSGGRGYQRPKQAKALVRLSTFDLPLHYAQWQKAGISVDISPVKLGLQPLLAGIKHINRLEQVLIKQHIRKDDAIVCDINNNVIEGSASNLFWQVDGKWFTPSLTHCGVEGVFRAFVVDLLMQLGHPIEIGTFTLSDLQQASSVFMCNALMHVVPVHAICFENHTQHYDVTSLSDFQTQVKHAYVRENEASY